MHTTRVEVLLVQDTVKTCPLEIVGETVAQTAAQVGKQPPEFEKRLYACHVYRSPTTIEVSTPTSRPTGNCSVRNLCSRLIHPLGCAPENPTL